MKPFTLALALGCSVALAAASNAQSPTPSVADSSASAPGAAENQIEIAYIAPSNSQLRPIYDRLRRDQILEELQQFLASLKLLGKLFLRTQQCDIVNAWYVPKEGIVNLCYEFVDLIERSVTGQTLPTGLDPNDVIKATAIHTALHEVSHGIFEQRQVPVFGNEEIAADQLATFLLMKFDRDTTPRLVRGAAHFYQFLAQIQGTQFDFSDTHGTPAQRFYTLLCIAYGGDPISFRDFVETRVLPKSRSFSCNHEYAQIKSAYAALLDVEHLKRWQAAQRLGPDDGGRVTLTFDDPIPVSIKSASTLTLNGGHFTVDQVDLQSNKVVLLGKESGLMLGLNFVQNLTFWYEGTVLKAFEQPYRSSYAIIAAIDDYDRRLDPQKRGPTGYPALTHMVQNAQALRTELLKLGFPAENIREFYNQDATRKSISDALEDFWEGGISAGASRVLFYFGGHGDGDQGNGYLVTYDFDKKRPTASGFLMADFTGRHFPLVKAHHFVAFIDSCSSGLAIPGMKTLGDTKTPSRATLAQIRAAVEQPARNLMVAGTNSQPAIANAGGIFTQALTSGLKGDADLLNNRLIQFDELAVYLKRKVIDQAAGMGLRQEPSAFKATNIGNGEVIFQLPRH